MEEVLAAEARVASTLHRHCHCLHGRNCVGGPVACAHRAVLVDVFGTWKTLSAHFSETEGLHIQHHQFVSFKQLLLVLLQLQVMIVKSSEIRSNFP